MEMIRSRRRLTSPVLRREHEVSRKPLRRECRSDFGVPVLACVRLFVLHARQWVRRAPGIPCALFLSRDVRMMHHPDASALRECGVMLSAVVRGKRATRAQTRQLLCRLYGYVGLPVSDHGVEDG